MMLSLIFMGWLIIPGPSPLNATSGQIIQAVVRLKTARVYLRAGEFKRALTWINLALSLNPGYAEALHVRGIVYYRMENLKEACLDWNQACEIESEWCKGLEFGRGRRYCP